MRMSSKSDTLRDLTTCPVCFNRYRQYRPPRLLSCSGQHSLCTNCLVQMLQKSQEDASCSQNKFRCHHCRQELDIPKSGVEEIPIHRVLLNLCTSRKARAESEEDSDKPKPEEVLAKLELLKNQSDVVKTDLQSQSQVFNMVCDEVLHKIHERTHHVQQMIWKWKEDADELVRKVKYETSLSIREKSKELERLQDDVERISAGLKNTSSEITISQTRMLLYEGEQVLKNGVIHSVIDTPNIKADFPSNATDSLYELLGSVKIVEEENSDDHYVDESQVNQSQNQNPTSDESVSHALQGIGTDTRTVPESSTSLLLENSHTMGVIGEKICPDYEINCQPVSITKASSAGGALLLCVDAERQGLFMDETGKRLSELRLPKPSKSLHDLACFGNDVFVTDRKACCFHVVTRSGVHKHKNKVGFKDPSGISINFPDVFITSVQTNRVYRLRIDKDHRVMEDSCCKFAESSGVNLRMEQPMFVDTNTFRVAVSCVGSHNVHVFTMDGKLRFTHGGTCGSGPDQLNSPMGISLDDSGNVFIADMNNHRVVILSYRGDILGCVASVQRPNLVSLVLTSDGPDANPPDGGDRPYFGLVQLPAALRLALTQPGRLLVNQTTSFWPKKIASCAYRLPINLTVNICKQA